MESAPPTSDRSARAGWNRMPIRRKLALVTASQSVVLLTIAVSVVYVLGRDLELSEIGAGLRARTAQLAEFVSGTDIALPKTGDADDGPLLSDHDRIIMSSLRFDSRLEQINIFGVCGNRFTSVRTWTLARDASVAATAAEADRDNPMLTRAIGGAIIDAEPRVREGRSVFSAYAPIEDAQGKIIAVLVLDADPKRLFLGTDYFRPVFAVMLIAGALLAFLSSHFLAHPFTGPLGRLVAATDAVARGDFDVALPEGGGEELRRVSESFNRMTQTVRRHQTTLEDNNRQLDLLNRQLRDTMVELEHVNSDLSESRNFFSTLVARTPSPIVVTDPEGRILLFNEAASDLFGWRADEIVGETFDRLFSQENRPEVRNELERDIRRGKVWHGEFLGRTNTGSSPLLAATVSPVRDDHGSILAYMYLAQNITETRQLQNLIIQMERMSTRGEMAGEIAHEINNYLTILGGNLDVILMLLAQGDHEKLQQKFESMKEVLAKIARFSDGLMGSNDTETERTQCDLNLLVEGLVAFLKPQNRYDGIHIQLDLDDTLPPATVGVGQLQQVLVNLLNNAADSIHEHGREDGHIRIVTAWEPREGGIKVRVSDNGTGIPAGIVSRLFRERYTSKARGHGLGLINCRRIIDSHRGRLEVESREGHGAHFALTIPVDDVTEILPPPLVRSSSDL